MSPVATREAVGNGEVEVTLKKSCYSCFKKERLAPCRGNSKGPCRNRRVLCPEHSNLKDGKEQCPECSESVTLSLGTVLRQRSTTAD